jgi:hypothetical protein
MIFVCQENHLQLVSMHGTQYPQDTGCAGSVLRGITRYASLTREGGYTRTHTNIFKQEDHLTLNCPAIGQWVLNRPVFRCSLSDCLMLGDFFQ